MAKTKSMTKSQILDHLSKKTATTKKLAGQFLDELVSLTYKEAKKSFTIPGLGKMVIVSRKKRMGRNPSTGETMVIPAKKVLKFRIAKQAKDNILPANGKK
jgi:DNA-binding protein HU-beta